MTDVYRELGDYISAALGDAVLRTENALDELMVYVPAARIERVLGFLRDDGNCQFKMLIDICGVDYPDRAERFDVVYNLLSLSQNRRCRAFICVGEGDATRRTFGVIASRNYFSTLGVDLMAGRTFSEEEERPGSQSQVAVVSYAYWKSHGGDLAMLGKSNRLNSRPFTIIGIAPRGFTGISALIAPEVWVPIGANELIQNDFMRDDAPGTTLADRRSEGLLVIGRLKPGLTPEGIAPYAQDPVRAARARVSSREQEPAAHRGQALARLDLGPALDPPLHDHAARQRREPQPAGVRDHGNGGDVGDRRHADLQDGLRRIKSGCCHLIKITTSRDS